VSFSRIAGCLLLALVGAPLLALPPAAFPSRYPVVAQCRDVTLSAAYLAEEKPGDGPGFYLQIENKRNVPVAIADPTPLSVHWYAWSGGRWLWRASSGEGGSLVNALRPTGPVFAETPGEDAPRPGMHLIAPHSTYSWSVFTRQTPALRYRPGCQHCTYQGEEQYQAVLAYAYLPTGGDASAPFLRCGLRSQPVVMPPLADSLAIHNSSGR
jgi:hypothetical protein